MLDDLGYLFAGFAVFWACLFGYIVWLQLRLRSVQQDLERLAERLEDATAGRAAAGGGERTGAGR